MPSQSTPLSLNWLNVIFLSATPILGIAGAIWWSATGQFNIATLVFSLVYLNLTGISITAGYHRLFSHRSYDAAKPVQWLFIALGSACFEGSVVDWSTDHRVHHRYQDREEDPYAIHKGFWFAHIGWLFAKNWRADGSAVPDLWKSRVIRHQHQRYILWSTFMGLVFPTLVCALWGDALGGLMIGGFLRVAINQQLTFLINSLCHYAGSKPFSDKITARDNWFAALLTYGEGYHNFHHAFPGDYRNGIRWHDFDATKWLIYGLSKVGLAWRLHEVPPERILQSKVLTQEKALREKLSLQTVKSPVLLEQIHKTIDAAKEQLALASERMTTIREQYESLKVQYQSLKTSQNKAFARQVADLRAKFYEAQRELKRSYQRWNAMRNGYMKLASL
ncbi:MAG: fatty acid desaturase [Chloroherpetonaceae bacterium]|nr:fatty acid desaturase [Chloroherpetonaceae bacterium]MDW8437101.1 fatty acid desaturase [Chloroherpetonaceae bacterium]